VVLMGEEEKKERLLKEVGILKELLKDEPEFIQKAEEIEAMLLR